MNASGGVTEMATAEYSSLIVRLEQSLVRPFSKSLRLLCESFGALGEGASGFPDISKDPLQISSKLTFKALRDSNAIF